jgi:hypothetical protein
VSNDGSKRRILLTAWFDRGEVVDKFLPSSAVNADGDLKVQLAETRTASFLQSFLTAGARQILVESQSPTLPPSIRTLLPSEQSWPQASIGK